MQQNQLGLKNEGEFVIKATVYGSSKNLINS